MLPAEDLGVKISVSFSWYGFGVRLAANLYALLCNERDVFWDEGIIEGVQIERRAELGTVGEWRWHRAVENVDCDWDNTGSKHNKRFRHFPRSFPLCHPNVSYYLFWLSRLLALE